MKHCKIFLRSRYRNGWIVIFCAYFYFLDKNRKMYAVSKKNISQNMWWTALLQPIRNLDADLGKFALSTTFLRRVSLSLSASMPLPLCHSHCAQCIFEFALKKNLCHWLHIFEVCYDLMPTSSFWSFSEVKIDPKRKGYMPMGTDNRHLQFGGKQIGSSYWESWRFNILENSRSMYCR